MKIAIIEDEQSHIDLLTGYLQNWSRKKQIRVEIISFTSAESFLFHWEDDRTFDVLFVDIQMEEMNGMDMARRVREADSHINIVFTTGLTDYLEEGYEVEALHYLLKPISEEKLQSCMDKVLGRKKEEHFLLVDTKEGVEKLPTESINYIEARGHGCMIEVIEEAAGRKGVRQLEVTESISELADTLDEKEFI